MSYRIVLLDKAKSDIKKLQKSGEKKLLTKLENLLVEISKNPRFGTGKPEQLKHYEKETWSRRLNDKNRLVYEIHDDIIQVDMLNIMGHYDDK